jgi:hypothetical protein
MLTSDTERLGERNVPAIAVNSSRFSVHRRKPHVVNSDSMIAVAGGIHPPEMMSGLNSTASGSPYLLNLLNPL